METNTDKINNHKYLDDNNVDQTVHNICNNIYKFTETEILKLLVTFSICRKINHDEIINHLLIILFAMIKHKNFKYCLTIKTHIDSIVMKKSNKHYYKLIKFRIMLDQILMNTIISNDHNDDVYDEIMLMNYLIYLLTKNYDDVYVVDDIIDTISDNTKKMRNIKILESDKIYHMMVQQYGFSDIVYQKIFDNLGFASKHYFRNMCSKFQEFNIVDMMNIDEKYLKRIDQKIINNYKKVVMLQVLPTGKITDLNHMIYMRKLDARLCKLNNDSIKNLTNIEELDITYNEEITNLNHMTKMRKLDARLCNLNNDSVKNLTNIEELNIRSNKEITNINHMTKMRKLDAGWCNLNNDSIKNLTNIEELDITNNK